MELIGLYLVAALLLVAAGAAKAVRPDDAARGLGAGLPLPEFLRRRPRSVRGAVRAVAGGEALLGALALAWPAPAVAAAVGASYLAFATVLVVVRARGGALASCGCLGRPDTPVTVTHVVIDLCLASGAAAVASAGTVGSMPGVLASQPGRGVPLVAVSLLAAWLAVLAVDELSRLVAVRRLLAVSADGVRAGQGQGGEARGAGGGGVGGVPGRP